LEIEAFASAGGWGLEPSGKGNGRDAKWRMGPPPRAEVKASKHLERGTVVTKIGD